MYRLRHLLLVFLVLAPQCAEAKTPKAFDGVRDHLAQSVKQGKVAGGVLVVWHKGQTVFATGFGYADIKTRRPFKIDTPVIVASISKPLLGTALYHIAQEKSLDLKGPITDTLPAFQTSKLESGEALVRPPTVTELLTHTAGLRGDNDKKGRIWFQSWTRNKPLAEVVQTIAEDIPFKHQPGKRMSYSGIGTEIAARIGEVTTGKTRNEMLRTYLSEPLGMTDTRYRDKPAIQAIDRAMPTRYYLSKETGELAISRERFLPDANRYSSSGGTIISTAPDLLRWLLMIRNAGVHGGKPYLSKKSMQQLLAPHPVGNRAAGGLAIHPRAEGKPPTRFGHTGSSGTSIWIDLETDTIVIMLTQTKGSDIVGFRKALDDKIVGAIKR